MGQETITETQFDVLVQIADVADDLRSLAGSLIRQATDVVEKLDAGFNPFGISYQTPFDYAKAEAKMETLLRVAGRAFDSEAGAALVVEAVKLGRSAAWSTFAPLREKKS